MLTICFSGRSRLSAMKIAQESEHINITRTNSGQVNWGRADANTELNPDISNATHKRHMRELFADNDVPAPKLLSVGEAIEHVLSGGKVVGRPDRHMKGRGFWLCRTAAEVKQAMLGTRTKRAATHFMEYIEAPREYRVHIFLGRSLRISEKEHSKFHVYTTRKPQHEVKHVRKAAKKAVRALGLDFGAVDVLADDTQAWVTEVNTAPGLGGSMPRVYADAFLRWHDGEWEKGE